MPDFELSILIPSRNEEWLSRTVQDILEHSEGKTEVIVGLDGVWAEPPIPDNDRVKLVYYPESIGQRAMTNQLARLSKAKYVMKCDAHCSFAQGFDVSMINAFAELGDNVTMAPTMRNLWAFDWICAESHTRYQGPSGACVGCGLPTTKKVMWIAKESPQSTAYCFDSEPHFQYFGELKKRQVGELVESMSLQGSAFMLTREKYWGLGICDEEFGSWGSQGIEVAVKTWLSGGRVIINKRTYYAHLFRTQGGDFSFPYEQRQSKVEIAKKRAKDLFFENKWPLQVRPLSWLVEKFWPVPGWTDEELARIKQFDSAVTMKPITAPTKGILYFTDNQLNLKIAYACQRQLNKVSKELGIPIISSSLKPMSFGNNIVNPGPRGYKSYFQQILAGLEASTADIIFLCEHDCLYPKEHFFFTPPDDKIYYNTNWWKIREDGTAARWSADQVSGLCARRETLLEYYRQRVLTFDDKPFDRKFEPLSGHGSSTWESSIPYIDIRHSGTLTASKWSLDDFRKKSTAENFQTDTIHNIPGWDNLARVFN